MLYTETVTRFVPVEVEESIEVPQTLVKLVNGRDPKYGRNGHYYMGDSVKGQKGSTLTRLHSYVHGHDFYHVDLGHPCDCPVLP